MAGTMDDLLQPTCWAGMQAMGTLLGTMFGFVSAALLTPIHGGEREYGLPAAPGVVMGSSLGVLAAYSAGEGTQPLRRLVYLLLLSVGAAAVTTTACSWLAGDVVRNGGSVGIMVLATVASLGSTAVFTIDKHNMLLTRAATAAAFDDHERHEGLSHLHEESFMDLKAV
ncbi:unnamed protein product [Ectocarpus sp. 12 AP-2014]